MKIFENFRLLSIGILLALVCQINCDGESEAAPPSGGAPGNDNIGKEYIKYIVSIRKKKTDDYGSNHGCTGTIIAEDLVLTAAHCLLIDKRFANAHEVTVVAGSKNRIEKSTTAQVVTAAQLMHYYEYFGFINTHNIALIKLEKKLVIDNVNTGIMKVAFLPPPVHSECVSLGWGRLYDDGPLTEEVVGANLRLIGPEICRIWLFSSQRVLCAQDLFNAAPKPACQLGEGGPLICKNEIVGVNSHHFKAKEGLPIFFTDATHYKNWIDKSGTVQFSHFVGKYTIFMVPLMILLLP